MNRNCVASRGPIKQALIEVVAIAVLLHLAGAQPRHYALLAAGAVPYLLYTLYRVLSLRVALSGDGLSIGGKHHAWPDIAELALKRPRLFTDGLVDLLTHRFDPRRFPPKIVIGVRQGDAVKRLTLYPLTDHEGFVSAVRDHAPFLDREAPPGSATSTCWEAAKPAILAAADSGSDADRAYAMDMLRRHAQGGSREAGELLRKLESAE